MNNKNHKTLLIDLLGELGQLTYRVTRLVKYGGDTIQPGNYDTNAVRLANKIGDVLDMFDKIIDAGIIDENLLDGEGRDRYATARDEAKRKYIEELGSLGPSSSVGLSRDNT